MLASKVISINPFSFYIVYDANVVILRHREARWFVEAGLETRGNLVCHGLFILEPKVDDAVLMFDK